VSFKLFVYYCTLCGAWAALIGWGIGWALTQPGGPLGLTANRLLQNVILGLTLGLLVAFALGTVDGVWNLSGALYGRIMIRGGLTGVVGGVGAAFGAALGYVLVRWSQSEFAVVGGWTFTGLQIGLAVSVFDLFGGLQSGDHSGGGRRKLRNALLGGISGGAVGGVLYVLAGNILPMLFPGKTAEDLVSPTSWGFVALGACVGLCVGLAQVVLKEAWVRVESGRRAGREMILSKDETTIGRAESCDVGLFGDAGVERLHARITYRDAGYVLSDAGTPGGTYLNDRRLTEPAALASGDLIRVGDCFLRFREKRKHNRREYGTEG
jgi:hypothetical protein